MKHEHETFRHIPSLRFLLFRKQQDCSIWKKKQRPFSLQSEIHISVMCVGFLAQTAQVDAKPSKRGGKL